MGLFSFFSREKKESLDKGLEKTKESFFGKITRAVAGKSKVDDEVLDNLEEVLVTSDVGVDTTLNIIKRIEERVARDKYVTTSELNGILRDEIASLLTENNTSDIDGFELPATKTPYVIMVVSGFPSPRFGVRLELTLSPKPVGCNPVISRDSRRDSPFASPEEAVRHLPLG